MRVEDIKRLVELVEQSQIDELEVRKLWNTVRISKLRRTNGRVTREEIQALVETSSGPMVPPEEAPAASGEVLGQPPAPEEAGEKVVPIRSPMVGTFYVAPSPTSPPYVEVGSRVTAGQVVCIIEAMKLMNEIESEVVGTVAKIVADSGQPVEFNQPLFLVRPDA